MGCSAGCCPEDAQLTHRHSGREDFDGIFSYNTGMRIVRVKAKDHYEAGYQLGVFTAKLQRAFLKAFKPREPWEDLIRKSLPFLNATKKMFPQYIDEASGLANGAEIPFEKMWVLHCLDEITQHEFVEKCSSVFIRRGDGRGYLAGHNEDWERWTKGFYFLLERTLDNKTVLELGMPGAICAGTVSVNSKGMVQAINSLHHTDYQVGTPKQIIARWLSSRESLQEIKDEFPKLKRAGGYAYNLLQGNKILAIESSAKQYEFYEAKKNYCHTNHYVGILKEVESECVKGMPSVGRYQHIQSRMKQLEGIEGLKEFLLHKAQDDTAVYRETETATVASIVIDPVGKICFATQENRGGDTRWQKIRLDFIE